MMTRVRLSMAFAVAALAATAEVTPLSKLLNELRGSTNRVFGIEAQVLYRSNGPRQRICIGVDGVVLTVWNDSTNRAFRSGDVIRSQARTLPKSDGRGDVSLETLEVVGRRPFPATLRLRAAEIVGGRHPRGTAVSVGGVLASVRRDDVDAQWNWLVLRTESGYLTAAATENEYPLSGLRELIDAEVTIHGVIARYSYWRGFLGSSYLLLFGEDGISGVRRAPADVFSAPEYADMSYPHRQLIRGRVVGRNREYVFLRADGLGFVPVSPTVGERLPAVGDRVEVSGFSEVHQLGPKFTEARFRILQGGAERLAQGKEVSPRELFSDPYGNELASSVYYGSTIRVRGSVLGSELVAEGEREILLDFGGHVLRIGMTSAREGVDADAYGIGTVLEVTGLCYAEFDRTASAVFPKFSGFTLLPRRAADLRVIRRPPWWTPFRLTLVIATLVLALVLFYFWNRSLRSLSERRGRQLCREQLDHSRAELKVEERTRLSVELHDSISQTLTGIAMQLDAAGEISEPRGRFLANAKRMLASCRQELRCCIWDLRSRTFEEKDLNEAVSRIIAPHLGKLRARVDLRVPKAVLSDRLTHAILRIVRELAVNAIRHGEATEIEIAGAYDGKGIGFTVSDNGHGFDPLRRPGPDEGHFGLQGVIERANDFNGDVTIESVPGGGTVIRVRLEKDDGGR